jgi:glycosyltransferase involved in cell wall biosynthesis
MNILVLTNVIPAPILAKKKRENDVLLKTAAMHEEMYKDVKYTFVYVLYTSFFARWLDKHKEHKDFLDLKSFTADNRMVEIISVPRYKWRAQFWSFYMRLAYLRNSKILDRIVKEKQIDVIHAHNIMADAGVAYYLSKRFKIPYLITSRQMGKGKLHRHIIKFMSHAKAIVSLSYQEKKSCDPFNNHSYMIGHGVEAPFLLQQKEYSSDKVLKIVTMARMLDWKNIDKVLYVLDNIREGFTYDIYGDGPEFKNLEEIVAKSSIADKVQFKGFIPYELVPQTMAQYDLFVLPSYKEWFGRVYIEAMACGLPIIGSRRTGMDGYITEGEHGFLVDHTNMEDLQQAIQKFISDKDLKVVMGQKAKVFAKDFTWDSVIGKLDRLYRDVAAGREYQENETEFVPLLHEHPSL